MRQILERLGHIFTLQSPTLLYGGVWLLAGLVWLLVVICALTSIANCRFSRRKKIIWAMLVVGVPLFGLLAYLPFSLNQELFPLLGVWRKPRQ